MTECASPRLNGVIESLPPDEVALLRSEADEVELAVNDVLLEAGKIIEHVYFPHEGMVSLLVVTPNGSIAEAGFVGFEGVVGSVYNSARTSFTRATVVAAGTALRVPLDQFELAIQRSGVLRYLVGQNNNRMTERAQQIAACNLLHQLEHRLSRWLLQVFENSADANVVITQDILAQMLGVNRSRLNEALMTLQKVEALSHTQRGSLTIIDANLIAERVCDCYRVMRNQNPN